MKRGSNLQVKANSAVFYSSAIYTRVYGTLGKIYKKIYISKQAVHSSDSKVYREMIGKCYTLELSLAGGAQPQRVLPEENLSLSQFSVTVYCSSVIFFAFHGCLPFVRTIGCIAALLE